MPRSQPQVLEALATVKRDARMAAVSHYNVQPVIDIFGAVQGRDLGGVSRDMNEIIADVAEETCRADRRPSCAGRSKP